MGVPHPRLGWGVPQPADEGTPISGLDGWGGTHPADRGVPHPRSGQGVPILLMGEDTPSKIRMGECPPPGQDWMWYPPPSLSRTGWGTPLFRTQVSITSTCRTAGGVPLAFMQDLFFSCSFRGKKWTNSRMEPMGNTGSTTGLDRNLQAKYCNKIIVIPVYII